MSKSDQSPADLVEAKRRSLTSRHREAISQELARLERQRQPAPRLPSERIERAAHVAGDTVRRGEGLLQSLYRSLIDDSARREEIAAAALQRRDEILRDHRAAEEAHALLERDIDAKVNALTSAIDQLSDAVEVEVRQFLDESRQPVPTKSKEVRLLRAHFAGLIGYVRTELSRPDGEQYEDLKRRVRSRDRHRCVCCQRGPDRGELHVHHVVPLSCCGTNAESNLVTLCHPCHNKQHPGIQVTRAFPIKRRPAIARFVAVGIETTGFSNDDAILEIAATRFAGGKDEAVFCSLVRSRKPVTLAITRRTGITQSMVNEAPMPEAVMTGFVEFTSKFRLVFHNASFGRRFVEKYLTYFDLPLPERVLDTLPVARKKLPRLPSHRLIELVDHLSLPVPNLRRAHDSSLATGHLFNALRRMGRRSRRRHEG